MNNWFRIYFENKILLIFPFVKVSKHLRKIWITTFRAMDDIKETVRNAGDSLCRAVSLLTVRLCDVSLTTSSDANETMNIVLPYLLSEGILSKVSRVQKASISLVMKLAKVYSLSNSKKVICINILVAIFCSTVIFFMYAAVMN